MSKKLYKYIYFHVKRLAFKFIIFNFFIIIRVFNFLFKIRIGGVDLSSFGQLIFFEYYLVKKKVLKSKSLDIIYCYNSFKNIGNNYTKVF